jgi:hypothetical protein
MKNLALKKIAVAVVGVVSFIYLLNFTMGIFELPDTLPIVGNMDEAAATAFFLSALRYYGLDLSNLFGKDEDEKIDTHTHLIIPKK